MKTFGRSGKFGLECSSPRPARSERFRLKRFGADTLGKLASRARKVGVIDAERVIPGWKANGNPFVGREHFSRGEFASEIVDRLEYLCVTETVTEKVMPIACLLWKGLGESLLPRMCHSPATPSPSLCA